MVLRPSSKLADVKTITATQVLAKRGLTMLRAKRMIEAMTEKGEIAVQLPRVENLGRLKDELANAGINAAPLSTAPLNVRTVRERLGLTQEQFAQLYNLELDAIQNWEQGRRTPDRTLQSLLRVISAYPKAAAKAQEQPELADDDLP